MAVWASARHLHQVASTTCIASLKACAKCTELQVVPCLQGAHEQELMDTTIRTHHDTCGHITRSPLPPATMAQQSGALPALPMCQEPLWAPRGCPREVPHPPAFPRAAPPPSPWRRPRGAVSTREKAKPMPACGIFSAGCFIQRSRAQGMARCYAPATGGDRRHAAVVRRGEQGSSPLGRCHPRLQVQPTPPP